MSTFHIPPDYERQILEAHRKLQSVHDNTEAERARWEAQLERIRNLYKWGDISEEEYLKEKECIQKRLRALAPGCESG